VLTNTSDAVSNRTVVQDSKGGTTTSGYDAVNQLTTREFSGTGQTPGRAGTVSVQIAVQIGHTPLSPVLPSNPAI
jgi:hypothetical protein